MSLVSFTGQKYDEDGNLKNWWSSEVDQPFKEKAQCFVDQYNGYEIPGAGKVTRLHRLFDI